MNVPPIRDIEERVSEAQRLLDELLEDYRWAAHAAWARPTRTSERVRVPSPSDPTADAATIGSLRSACRSASRKLDEAVGRLSSAVGVLGDRMDHLDPPRSREPLGPRLAGPSDLAEAKAAQARRMARGEGWGDG